MNRFGGLARVGFIWIWELLGLIASMSIPIANVFLAIPWGWVFARWARTGPSAGVTRRAWILTLYSVVPCFALTLLPIILWLGSGGQWDILDPLTAYDYFRMPLVLGLPFPFNTIFGFYWGCALAAVVLKILITTLLARIVLAATASQSKRRQ